MLGGKGKLRMWSCSLGEVRLGRAVGVGVHCAGDQLAMLGLEGRDDSGLPDLCSQECGFHTLSLHGHTPPP